MVVPINLNSKSATDILNVIFKCTMNVHEGYYFNSRFFNDINKGCYDSLTTYFNNYKASNLPENLPIFFENFLNKCGNKSTYERTYGYKTFYYLWDECGVSINNIKHNIIDIFNLLSYLPKIMNNFCYESFDQCNNETGKNNSSSLITYMNKYYSSSKLNLIYNLKFNNEAIDNLNFDCSQIGDENNLEKFTHKDPLIWDAATCAMLFVLGCLFQAFCFPTIKNYYTKFFQNDDQAIQQNNSGDIEFPMNNRTTQFNNTSPFEQSESPPPQYLDDSDLMGEAS